MSNATITIHLTQEAQRAALVAGEPSAAKQTYEVPQALVPRLLALYWTDVHEDGTASCEVPDRFGCSESEYRAPVGTPLDLSFRRRYASYGNIDVAADKRPADAEAAIVYAEGVVPRVTAYLDEYRRNEARKQEERDAQIRADVEKWLTFPLSERATADGIARATYVDDLGVEHVGHSGRSLMIDVDDLKRFAPDAYREATAEVARLRREKEALEREAAKAEEAAKAACEAALRELAAKDDELARAATDGYPIARAMLDKLVTRLVDATTGEGYEDWDSDVREWGSADAAERSAPSPAAFKLLDEISAAARTANETLPASVGKWEVSRILRIDVCSHVGRRHYVTAVLATLRTPLGLRQVTFSTESLACDHGDNGDD